MEAIIKRATLRENVSGIKYSSFADNYHNNYSFELLERSSCLSQALGRRRYFCVRDRARARERQRENYSYGMRHSRAYDAKSSYYRRSST
jgi:hypothetical protein